MMVPAVCRNARPWSRAVTSALVIDGQLVPGQLQDHRPHLAAKDGPSEQERRSKRGRRADHVATRERQSCQCRPAREQQARQQHVHRQPCRATHERQHQNRREPVAPARNQARAHDGGHGAGMRGQQRNERLPRQAKPREESIVHECRAGEITRVFQQADEEEQQHDLRQEHDRARDAADHAVDQQIAKRTRRQQLPHHRSQAGEDGLDQIHGQRGQGEERPEQAAHHRDEDERAGDRMREEAIEALGQPIRACLAAGDRRSRNTIRPRRDLRQRRPGRRRVGRQRRRRALEQRGDALAKGFRPDALRGDRRHDGRAKTGAERRDIDGQLPLVGNV